MPRIVVRCQHSLVTERGFALRWIACERGEAATLASCPVMTRIKDARRFSGVSRVNVSGQQVPIASDLLLRLLGLAHLDRREAGRGLLIPRCSSVHTFGMRFSIDVHFLDARGVVIRTIEALGPRKLAWCRGADSVLELVIPGPGRDDRSQ